jgi:hypothetical protein
MTLLKNSPGKGKLYESTRPAFNRLVGRTILAAETSIGSYTSADEFEKLVDSLILKTRGQHA